MATHPRFTAAGENRSRVRRYGFVLALLACGLYVLPTCTSPQQQYKVLSLIFDGVPDPDAPAASSTSPVSAASSVNSIGRVIRPPVSTHQPFKEEKCNACHSGTAASFESVTRLNAAVCMNCHRKVPDSYRYMHGPVVSGVCLMCHDPHRSSQPHLLKATAPELCLQCHQRNDLGPPAKDHQDVARNCLDCHVGHGGSRRGLLRDIALHATPAGHSPTNTAPASMPASESSNTASDLVAPITPNASTGGKP